MRKRCALIAGMLGLLPLAMMPTTADPMGPHQRGARLMEGWLPYWTNADGNGGGWKSVADNAGRLDSVSFFAYSADSATGNLTPPAKGMDEASIVQEVGWLHTHQVQCLLTVALFGKVNDFLSSAPAQSQFIANVLATTDRLGLDGVDIDFEDFKDKDPDDSARFTQFIETLCTSMHAQHDFEFFPKAVTVTVLGRTSRGSFNFADDVSLGNSSVDRVRVMAYDEYYAGSKTAGPSAPLPWQIKVGDYIKTLTAPTWKYELGIPAYGYRWTVKSADDLTTTAPGLSETYDKAQKLMGDNNAARIWDAASDTPRFQYTNAGQVWAGWYEDKQSWEAKIDQVLMPSGMGGLSEWALGFEDPGTWPLIDEKFATKYNIYGVIGDCYAHFGGGARFGQPLTDVIPAGAADNSTLNNHRGIEQDFEHGRIYYRWGDPRAYAVTGAFVQKYIKSGGPSGLLGFPIGDATAGATQIPWDDNYPSGKDIGSGFGFQLEHGEISDGLGMFTLRF